MSMRIIERIWRSIRYPQFFILSPRENSDNLTICFVIFGALICGAPLFTSQSRQSVFVLCVIAAVLFIWIKHRNKIFSFDGLMNGIAMLFFLWLFAQVIWTYIVLLIGFLIAGLQILRELFALWLNTDRRPD